jgi:phosphohistidine phosphatase SixA
LAGSGGCSALEPARPPAEGVEVLQRYEEQSVALVGDKPHVSALASLLLTGDGQAVHLALKEEA